MESHKGARGDTASQIVSVQKLKSAQTHTPPPSSFCGDDEMRCLGDQQMSVPST